MSQSIPHSVILITSLLLFGCVSISCGRNHGEGNSPQQASPPETLSEPRMSLTEFIDSVRDEVLEGEDDETTCDLDGPATDAAWQRLKERLSFELPGSLRDWWRYCDGGDYFGSIMMCIGEVPAQYTDGFDSVAFHSWGNGDFDHVVASENAPYPVGAVIFYCHENGRHALVTNTLEEWFKALYAEVKSEGGVNHPFDFLQPGNADRQGMYRRVFEEIRD